MQQKWRVVPTFIMKSCLKLEDKYSDLKQQIKVIYHPHKGYYGYRRITLALRNTGLVVNHKCG